MKIGNFFRGILTRIEERNDDIFKSTIAQLKTDLKTLEIKYALSEKLRDATELELEGLYAEYDNLAVLYEEECEESELELFWNTKYPTGKIVYKGRPLPLQKTNINIPVNVLITPNDPFIIQDLEDWNLLNVDEDSDTLIPKIYKKIKSSYYRYSSDKATWGATEIWEFPFEVRAARKDLKKGVDCDSWSHFMASYYIAAGVPRWKVRVVVGNTELGGHSTIYVYSEMDNKWHHINSTYGSGYSKTRVTSYPTHDDAENGKDKIGINKVWFSFNDLYCWYNFEGDIPKELQIIK